MSVARTTTITQVFAEIVTTNAHSLKVTALSTITTTSIITTAAIAFTTTKTATIIISHSINDVLRTFSKLLKPTHYYFDHYQCHMKIIVSHSVIKQPNFTLLAAV